ncbi:MAG: DUF4080 domain-containing protein [Planctomycetaceae bacterium]|nr:DUF4080 domain-containing protein [Planctomycetaceae bacterium]
MADILLATLNARYAHSSFGLRYLMANLGELESRAAMLEFDISRRSVDMLEAILQHSPRIVGLGVYIWNIEQTTKLVQDLKRVAPETIVILGGPEVSYECDDLEIAELADYIITGEADLSFAEVCSDLLADRKPLLKVIPARLPQFGELQFPYRLYTDRDLRQRVVYVEASRGCPFTCEFCLSALDIPVRQAELEPFLAEMEALLKRGLRQFKFVDRTFNLNLQVSRAILQFFLDRYEPGLFLHFEMIPDRLPDSLRDLIRRFPAGALQFEVGIQTFNDEVCELISRRQNVAKLEENLKFLRDETGVHVHADLIVGLPGEDLQSFGAGFDRLTALEPQEIQVGILKRLRGTPIVRHDAEWEMVYSPTAPYEILRTKLIDFGTMQRLRRFARYWDLVANSGNFLESTPLIWQHASPFDSFLQFSDWLYARTGATNGIALGHLAEHLFRFLMEERQLDEQVAANAIWSDYTRAGRSDRPAFLRPYALIAPAPSRTGKPLTPTRQARHLS